MPRPLSPGRPVSHRPSSARAAPGVCFLAISHSREKPWPLFITTSDALPASGSRPIHAPAPRGKRAQAADASTAASPASPQADSPLLCPLRRTAQPMPTCAAPATGSPPSRRHPTFLPTPPPPAACWPATESPSPALAPTWLPLAASARPWRPDWTRPTTRSCPQAYPRPGNAPRSTWGYASGTRSCTRRRWPNCTS